MSEIIVTLDGAGLVFAPGGQVAGQVTWESLQSVREISVRLFWFTQGKGTQDVGIADTQVVSAPPESGVYGFAFTLPAEGPVSFSGKLVSLVWAVEAVAKPSGEVGRQEFVVSTTGAELDLTHNSALAAKEDEVIHVPLPGFVRRLFNKGPGGGPPSP